MENLSLYVHIPFCEAKCFYCSFCSVKAENCEKQKYVEYLIKEIELQAEKYKNFLVTTIYIGGGTPSCLENGAILEISKAIFKNFNVDKKVEFSIEANPNSLTKQKCEEFFKAKINRISVGLQAYNNKQLKMLGRLHNKKDFLTCIKNAKQAGLKNINADILLGIPKMNKLNLKHTLKKLVKLNLTHISCYSLILEKNTKLFSLVKSNKIKLPTEKNSIKFYDFCVKFLKKHGYLRYEVSNFALSGFECKHNLIYWNLENYLGLGLSSHSKISNIRFNNTENFKEYYNFLDKNKLPIKQTQKLSLTEQKEDYIMLKLRTNTGINLKEYQINFNEDLFLKKAKEIDFLLKNNFIEIVNDNLFATDLGFKVLNNIILKLID